MKSNNLTQTMKKIIDGMQLVRPRLFAYKIKMNNELVVMKNGKVVKIKPQDVSLTENMPSVDL